jgi:hypothetical protein
MALTIESALSELLANESVKAILDRHCPGLSGDSRIKMAMGMTLKQVMPFSQGQITAAAVEAIAADLAKL